MTEILRNTHLGVSETLLKELALENSEIYKKNLRMSGKKEKLLLKVKEIGHSNATGFFTKNKADILKI